MTLSLSQTTIRLEWQHQLQGAQLLGIKMAEVGCPQPELPIAPVRGLPKALMIVG